MLRLRSSKAQAAHFLKTITADCNQDFSLSNWFYIVQVSKHTQKTLEIQHHEYKSVTFKISAVFSLENDPSAAKRIGQTIKGYTFKILPLFVTVSTI